MKKATSLIMGLALAISGTLALSQQVNELGPNTQDDIPALGPPLFVPNTEYDSSNSGISTSRQVPQRQQMGTDTAIRLPVGEAPFYAALSSYILLLYPQYQRGHTVELQREADVLGLSLGQYQEVLSILQLYRARAQNDWSERQRDLCRPVFLTGDISNEEAMQALAELDDDAVNRNAIAHATIEQVGASYGSEVEAAVRNHLEGYRASLEFSRTDMVKFVELKSGMDHRTYFINQCLAM